MTQGSWETFFFEITAFFSHLHSAWQKAGNFKEESLSTTLRRSYIVFALTVQTVNFKVSCLEDKLLHSPNFATGHNASFSEVLPDILSFQSKLKTISFLLQLHFCYGRFLSSCKDDADFLWSVRNRNIVLHKKLATFWQ